MRSVGSEPAVALLSDLEFKIFVDFRSFATLADLILEKWTVCKCVEHPGRVISEFFTDRGQASC